MELFHTSGLMYEPGDVIQPGNWGRVILGAGPGHNLYFRELLFEEVRTRVAPDRPSRLTAFFAVRTLEQLERYQQEVGGMQPHAYRVEVDDSANVFEADLETFHRLPQARGHEAIREIFEQYWSDDGGSMYLETLVEAPATVIERLNS